MKRTIDIGSVKGINTALELLETAMSKEALKEKVDKVAFELVDEGMEIAAEAFAGTPVQISVEKRTDGYTLNAEHEEIAFLEFGAGITTDGSGEIAAHAPFNVEEGSYSVSKNPPGMYAQTGFQYWEHNGEKMNAVMPRQGMEFARQHIVDNAEKKLKEVFGVD